MRKIWMLIAAVSLTYAFIGQAHAKVDGAAVYKKCSGCHKSSGEGVPGDYPPLSKYAARLVNADRTFPIKVVLFGLNGKILVEGKAYEGTMPAYAEWIGDDEIAALLNYMLSRWGNDKMLSKEHREFTASEVHDLRGRALTPEQVYESFKKLKLE